MLNINSMMVAHFSRWRWNGGGWKLGVNKQNRHRGPHPTTTSIYSWLGTGLMISITIINHDTKNIYESDLADKTWTRLAFLSTALHNVVGEEADWNNTDALHMFGLHVRWLVAPLRHAPPELASKHAMQPHRLEQVKQANSSRSTNMLTDVVSQGIYNICNGRNASSNKQKPKQR